MIKNILIIGCGLIGSSILRAVHAQKVSKNIYIFEKSKKNISIIKKLKISNFNKNSNNNLDKRKLLLISFISGGTALLMELVFFRLASTNWPSSAYNFPIILMVFLGCSVSSVTVLNRYLRIIGEESQENRQTVLHLVKNGIDASRIEAKGYGEKRHIASNDTTLGRGKNRRVVIQMQKL